MSTISVTNVTTANGSTNLILQTGNTSAGDIIIDSVGGVTIAANSTVNTYVANSTGSFFVGNVTSNSIITDSKGDVRDIPVNAQTAVYQLSATDAGRVVSTTANVTVNGAVLVVGEAFSIYNNSASSITITSGTGVTMYLGGTATTGNRTLAQRGIATILMVGSNTFVIGGAGVT